MNRTTFADRIALPIILFQGYVIGKIFSLLKYKSVKNIFILFTMMYSYTLFFIWAFYNSAPHGYHIKIFYLINENNIFYNDTLEDRRIREFLTELSNFLSK